ncbi:LysR family transcriptional regulator [Allorhodopirellula solitaria]|uniref:HTH-type transcriptional regulator GltC n=1 Tax=Allorhodopirellula solitaria TaxID=2527987 RepID=A0A5C5XSX3_9BACT|nr:LysR family transcriptional regulator [Allorhodopirellula solitaria]TWT65105.1 HTH-type transcriptional regulator GltC [Allorhodopirellula solitaria]
MQLRTFELFCHVADQRSFSKAAVAAGVTQSAVSQSIGHLEESIGSKLFDRSKRPLTLTEAGQIYLLGVREIVRQYKELIERVQEHDRHRSDTVTVGAVYSVGLSYMPEATKAFEEHHPDVRVRTEFGSSQRVVELVLENKVDFGLVSFPRATKVLGTIPWQSEPMRLVCSAEHALACETEVSAAQLNGIEMIGFERGLVLRQSVDQCFKAAGISVVTAMEFDNCDSIVRAIQANRGIGMIPEAAVRRETADGTLRVIACREIQMVRPLGIIFRKRGALSGAAIDFGSLLLGHEMEHDLLTKNEAAKADRERCESQDRAASVLI